MNNAGVLAMLFFSLDPFQPEAEALLQPCSDDWLKAFAVSTKSTRRATTVPL